MVPRGFVHTTLFVALAIALRLHGLFHVHGGAVVRGDGARVLVLGDSGSGKSTVTLALVAHDPSGRARHLGDDALFVTASGERAELVAFPRPFHLGPATLAAFPSLLRAGEARDANGKRDVPLDAVPGAFARRMDAPHVVLFPRVTRDAETRVVAISMADAFGHALRSTALVAVDGMPRVADHLGAMRALLAGARAFELPLGADWLADPATAVARVARAWGDAPPST